ncbi:hypothetical protein GJU40_17130 [Bacillus lacus]|uniref:Membrane protein YkvI n=1 Tax=Metabacillus lacus TaxID=1983721 RepID=A0A7X2M0A9_9BACI|nr:hypothetical protein [Metabacillus lacus]MRX73868.1 hypothetical protein [Metabacillus lacus]
MKNSFTAAVQVGAVYVGTIVGAGFATGREIVEFFTRFGMLGMLGILLAGCLFIWLGMKILIISRRIGANSYKEFNLFLFGSKLGSIINVFMFVVLLAVTAVMISGAGAVFQEQLNVSKQVGMIATVLLALLVMKFGVKGLLGVNMLVVPVLILFSIILAVNSFSFTIFTAEPVHEGNPLSWLLAAVSYASFNLAMAQAVLVPLAKEIEDEKALKLGGWLGGGVLAAILLSSHIALSGLPGFIDFDIPMGQVMKGAFSALFYIYILVIYGEIFTSVIGNLFGIERLAAQVLKVPKLLTVAAVLAVCFVFSQYEYSSLISFLYPLFGYMSLGFMVLLIGRKFPEAPDRG